MKNSTEENLEYKFGNGGLGKKFITPNYITNKTTVSNKFSLLDEITLPTIIDLLDQKQKKLLWQNNEKIDFKPLFNAQNFVTLVNEQKFTTLKLSQARFDKVRSDFFFSENSNLNFDELLVSRRSRSSRTQIINSVFFTSPILPLSSYQSAFYTHETVKFTELSWINESIVSISSLITEKSKSNWLTNFETNNTPDLVYTSIFSETKKDLTSSEVISFVPDRLEVPNSTPSNTDGDNPEVADTAETEFDGDNKSQVVDSAFTLEPNTNASNTEIVNSNPTKVPEPSTISLFSLSLIGIVVYRHRKHAL
ncbi:PEP-CTERM sorting domain-containing protein [Pleurocapsales cyanobacterium LEGE 06147]|nr:PEP-CTERM sorting domain-containing protein [Pleurocapsales cyanobacterium LEGE 06147]